MNTDTVIQSVPLIVDPVKTAPNKATKKSNSSLLEKLMMLSVLSLIVYGWLIREEELFTAESGWGYWLGIIGGALMLLLMLYPLRKNIKAMRNWGTVRFWFRFHMLLGVLGPTAILYHANFGLGSINSNVALFAMLIVASSGLIGRFFYSKIHQGLYGKKISLQDLQKELDGSSETFARSQLPSAEIINDQLNQFSIRYMKIASHFFLGILLLPFITLFTHSKYSKIKSVLKKDIKQQRQNNSISAQEAKEFQKLILKNIKQYLHISSSAIEFKVYERIFSLWHMFHLPLFIIMLMTGIYHVYAVHMY